MPSFFQLLANSGISPLVPPHSTAFSSQKSNSTEGGCSDDEEEEKHKLVTEGKHKTWTRRKCIWRWRRRVGNCTKSFLYSIGWSWTIADLTFADVPASRSNIRIVEIERLCSQNTNKTAPKDLIYNIFNSDTRLWNIDHFTILNEYVAAMAILPFVVGSLHNDLKLSIYSNKVLIIGLGGGSLDMFWHKRFPWLNITIFEINPNVVKLTEKWFDAVNDDTRHVFVQDGILAFNGKLNIKRVRKAVNNNGVAIFNLLPLENEEENVKRFVQRRLAAHFPTCIRYKMAKQSNNILACLPYSITQRRKSSKEPTELTNEMF
uniref:PABS domain-containing protein n=1 Tax=Meloidogyne floridensis TaxID=298350 RepID=A0A915P5A7_9BILA